MGKQKKLTEQIAIHLDLTQWELLQQMYNDAQKHCMLIVDNKRKNDYSVLMADIALERKGYFKVYTGIKQE